MGGCEDNNGEGREGVVEARIDSRTRKGDSGVTWTKNVKYFFFLLELLRSWDSDFGRTVLKGWVKGTPTQERQMGKQIIVVG